MHETNEKQLQAAGYNLIDWLRDPNELGKPPYKMQCTGEFGYDDMTYYTFRFKKSCLGPWLLGISGGFEGDSLEPCGHTYSEMKPYREKTVLEDSTRIIEMIKAYWKKQAEKIDSQNENA